MGPDPFLCSVKHRAEPDHRLHGFPRLFNPYKLLVSQGQILGTQFLIIAVNNPHAVPLDFLPDGHAVDSRLTVFKLAKIRSVATGGEQAAGPFKKQFKLTRRGHNALSDGITEPHFYRLLNTFAVKFNWAFQDGYPPLRIIQRSWLFSLFLLHEKAKANTEDVALAKFFIKAFPETALEIDSLYTSEFEYLTHCFSLRFLERFCEYFGFVECRREKQKELFSVRLFAETSPLFETYFIWGVQ